MSPESRRSAGTPLVVFSTAIYGGVRLLGLNGGRRSSPTSVILEKGTARARLPEMGRSDSLKRVLRVIAAFTCAFVVAGIAALETWYQALLPLELPRVRGDTTPALVRSAIWLTEFRGQGSPRLRPAYPFLLGALVGTSHPESSLSAHVARVHIRLREGEGTLHRAMREIALATWVSRHWSAEQALDSYASLVWMGDNQRGLPEAAPVLFGKPLGALTRAECALLVAMMRSPNAYSPLCHPERARQARDEVLERLRAGGFLSQQQFDESSAAELNVRGRCEVQK